MGLRTLRFLLVAWALVAGRGARAAGEAPLDWDAWEQIPVLHDGRIKPLDTFARMAVRDICGTETPRLGLAGALAEGQDESVLSGAQDLFPGDRPRRFRASELLFSWIVEPEEWRRVPLLPAADERLRADVLGLPLRDARGSRLKYVSWWQAADVIEGSRSAEFHSRLSDPKADDLLTAFGRYDYLLANLTMPQGPAEVLATQLQNTIRDWRELEGAWQLLSRSQSDSGADDAASAPAQAAEDLQALVFHGQVAPDALQRPLLTIRQAATELSTQLEAHLRQIHDNATGLDPKELQQAQTKLRALAAKAAQTARNAGRAQFAAVQYRNFGNRYALAVIPAMNPAALERKRDPDPGLSPWLDLSALLWGTKEVKGFPPQELQQVRKSFFAAAAAYRDRAAPDRPQRFAEAMNRFALALAALGEAIEPLRQELPIRNRDEGLMARTAYPPLDATWTEVHYNRLDPFGWTWVLSLAAFVASLAAIGPLRRPAFWLAVALLTAALAMMVYGFTLRTLVTVYTPVATMFETVIFMALVVALLGLWFAILPFLAGGLRLAWQWTALPFTWETPPPQPQQPSSAQKGCRTAARSLAAVARAALAVGVFYALTMVYFGAGEPGEGEPVVLLLPRVGIGASMPTIGELVIWVVGLGLLVPALYYLPRAILAGAISLGTVPRVLACHGLSEPVRRAIGRKAFVACGAFLAFGAAYAATHVPIFDKSIKTLQPILRHSFWLAVHVATIMASYGAGALAWALGSISLGYYLFGRYRDPMRDPAVQAAWEAIERTGAFQSPADFDVRRAPEACATLSAYIYRVVQIAAILLFAGTVLGAAWADKAWGRYWGWDQKEVWALVCFLVWMVILHARHTGWIGNFGLAAGTVLEASAIMMTWYGVGSGKHAYGSGEGGLKYVLLVLAANWLFVGVAWFRYWLQTRVLAGGSRQ